MQGMGDMGDVCAGVMGMGDMGDVVHGAWESCICMGDVVYGVSESTGDVET